MAKRLVFNGINGSKGTYGLPPMTEQQLSDHILNIEIKAPENLAELQARQVQDKLNHIRAEKGTLESLLDMATDPAMEAKIEKRLEELAAEEQKLSHLGVVDWVDRTSIKEAGWGIIFEAENPMTAQIKEALSPLLKLRESQTEHFKIYEGKSKKGGFRSKKDSARSFLGRHGARASDPADPTKVPYYLLIVGSPEEIDFHHQYQLDVQYAVGRIDFGDDLQAYANYANSVAEAASGKVKLAPIAKFFGVANADDPATNLSATGLIKPLQEKILERQKEALEKLKKSEEELSKKEKEALQKLISWQLATLAQDQATKSQLQQLLGGADTTPAFLFTASHGMEFDISDPRQPRHQGALLCQDWPGPRQWPGGEIPQDFYFAGDDITSDTNLLGMIAFFFACFGGGTPLFDEFSKEKFKTERTTITEKPFVASLPQAMLSLSKGGALAVAGHVDRAWGNSFLGDDNNPQIGVFQSAIEHLLKGSPIGSAMEYFNERYAALSTELTEQLEQIDFGRSYDPYDLAGMWTSNNDARGYVIVGDPAVSLPFAAIADQVTGRHAISDTPVTIIAPVRVKEIFEKPDDISEEDWKRTPDSVKRYVQECLGNA